MTETRKKMLFEHYNMPDKIITAAQLSHICGWKNFTAANLHYGKLAAALKEELQFSHNNLDLWTIAIFEKDLDQDEWRWIMRKEVALALEQLFGQDLLSKNLLKIG